MEQDQSTSKTVEPVTDGQSDTLISVTKNYPGGKDNLELARANPNFRRSIWNILDELAAEQALRLSIIERPTWKTIQLGTGLKTAEDFCAAIEKASGRVGDWAKNIMSKDTFVVADQPIEIKLVIATTKELTGKDVATTEEVFAGAECIGWKKCPPEVPPQLRLQYMDQPEGECLNIATELPIPVSSIHIGMFNVAHDGYGRWLFPHSGDPYNGWTGSDCWVFCRPK